ncbi:MAG: ATP-binding protein [Lachnospiraceae bacterium]
MLVGRKEQFAFLQKIFGKLNSSIVVVYGRTGMGKTSLAREFIKDKDSFYYSAIPAAADEARLFMANCVYGQSDLNAYLNGYEDIFVGMTKQNKVKKVIVIDEFQNISRSDEDFLESVFEMVKNQPDYGRVMVILLSSSVSYVESHRDKLFKPAANYVSYLKLEALSFMDSMHFFANYSIEDCVRFYGLTGGVPEYIVKLSKKLSVEENICRNMLVPGSYLHEIGHDVVKEELRETGLYNTILGCLAGGMNKINDIYNYTGFGRDKISVYLKNLMERDIVEKVYSYDISGKPNIKKGCYRIKPGIVEFWYRYIYPNQSALAMMDSEKFYETYIKDSLDEFMQEGFVQVCSEYLKLLEEHNGLSLTTVQEARVYEKECRVDIIREAEDKKCVAALCDFSEKPVGIESLKTLVLNCKNAQLSVKSIFLFAKSGFDSELQQMAAKDENMTLVGIGDL